MKVMKVADDCISLEKDGVCILFNKYEALEAAGRLEGEVLIMNREDTTEYPFDQEKIEAEIGQQEWKRKKED